MGLLSFFQRRNGPAAADARLTDSPDAISAARTSARRRLMGAAVLLMAGVVGFPLVFETQPRPVPVDIPIEIPRKDGAPALSMPPARLAAARASSPIATSPREEAPAAPASRELAAPASAPAAKASAAEPVKKALAEAKPAAAAPAPAPASDAARAKALLEGKDAAKPGVTAAKPETAREGGRFVVQVGAFADAAAAREMRGRVDKLGLKSYMQVVETSTGSRTRVRAGPFESRDEAEKALAKAKAAGLNAVVLTL